MVHVARCAGISVEALRKIEGGRIPSAGFCTVAAIVGTLGVSLDELAEQAHTAAPDPSRQVVA